MADQVRVWDEWGEESNDTDAWSTWSKVKAVKGFPGGLIAYLQTSTDSEGCGFPSPTLVQAYAWPILQSGKDLVGVAKTGSGKTLAFLLPGFIKLRKLKKAQEIDTSKGPALLTMTPTRELCHQIYTDAAKFGKPVQITAACAYGGAPKRDQEWELRQSPDCLIATPGRLNDFCNNGSVDLSQVRFAVLDEADRMLDMGFEPQIKEVMDRVSSERQTAMFTATWPKECKDLAKSYIKWPVQIQVGSDDITTNQNITQNIEVVEKDSEKMDLLKKILGQLKKDCNCLVFCNTKKKCRDLNWELNGDKHTGMPTVELHGDLDQKERDTSLAKFKAGEARVMVATDVAARGLDIRNITIVVNYDTPNSAEDYVHRIGRTGRASDKGTAYTFVSAWGEEKKAQNILSIMEKAGQEPPEALKSVAAGKGSGQSSSWGDDWKKDDKDDWKKDDWKKDDKDDWKKDDWKKDDWKKDGKDDWKKDDWKKDDWKKDDWKKDDWKKDDEKKDDWKKDDEKKDDSKKDDEKKDDTKKEEDAPKEEKEAKDAAGSAEDAAAPAEEGEPEPDAAAEAEEPDAADEDMPEAEGEEAAAPEAAAEDEAAGGVKRTAPDAAEDEPPAKVSRTEEAPAGEDGTDVAQLVRAGEGSKLKISELKAWLEDKGLPINGVKSVLIDRVQEALDSGAG